MGNKLWKIEWLDSRLHPNGYGDVFESGSGNYITNVSDLQNSHMSVGDETNGTNLTNTEVEPALWSVARYGSPTGLLEIMK
jgi:hypothetical protein